MMRRQNTGWSDGLYSLPAGHIDGSESARTAMIREANEEVGISIKPEDLSFALIVHRNSPDREYIDFYFVVEDWQGEPYNAEPDKCDDLRWSDIDKIRGDIIPNVKQALEAYREGLKYVEYGWDNI